MSDAPEPWRENVAAIVMDASGRVLLGLDEGGSKPRLHFPQGGVGRREALEDALRRELQEEVGLAPARYRIVASLGGLRYRYRKRNEKRERYVGQQQTYFLLQCYGNTPPTDCSGSAEFHRVEWLPWQQLRPELFVKFKREAVARALAHFFPPGAAAPVTASGFGGGKEEAALHLARLSRQLCLRQKQLETCGGRLLIVLHGEEGTGRRQAARRLAALMDPLRLRVVAGEAPTLLPAAGECVLLTGDGATLPPLAGSCMRLYLHGEAAAAPDGWQAIPADPRWARDIALARTVADALSALCLPPPLTASLGM